MFMDILFPGFMIALVLILVFSLYRNRNSAGNAKRIVETNEKIVENQARSIDLQERQSKAIERIADALEKR